MHTTYVDDTVAFEIIPRNSISMLEEVVRETHDYCMEHEMKLNPKKCREMYLNFMKIFGVIIISDDPEWNTYVEYVIAKAAKRLYPL